MDAHVTEQEQGLAQLEALWAAKLKEASLNGFMLGGTSAMKLAADKYGDRIREATDFDTLKTAALELLEYLSDKAEGLQDVAEEKKDD